MAIKLRSNADGTCSILNGATEAIAIGASGEVDLPVKGSLKAWVNFNGTGTITIRGSHNISSITDHGTGDYTFNFSDALQDTNYLAVFRGDGPVSTYHTIMFPHRIRSTQTISAFAIGCFNITDSAYRAYPSYAYGIFVR